MRHWDRETGANSETKCGEKIGSVRHPGTNCQVARYEQALVDHRTSRSFRKNERKEFDKASRAENGQNSALKALSVSNLAAWALKSARDHLKWFSASCGIMPDWL
jgi:hypothetical protein